jgi:hypothetical protein
MPNFLFFIFETKDSYTKVNRNTKSRTKAEARRGDKGPEQSKQESTLEGHKQKWHKATGSNLYEATRVRPNRRPVDLHVHSMTKELILEPSSIKIANVLRRTQRVELAKISNSKPSSAA